MVFGSGYGVPFGGGTPGPLASPASVVGAPPVVFDFSSDADGALPGAWEFFALADDGTGAKLGSGEAVPTTYFRVVGGLGWWRFTRAPVVPGVGAPFVECGYVASPVGVLLSRDAEVAVAFVAPTELLDARQDEFQLEVMIGLRATDDAASFVGGRARAVWQAGVWTTPVALEVVRAQGFAPAVLASAVFDPPNDPTEWWRTGHFSELAVTLREGTLTATLNGMSVVQAAVPDADGTKVCIFARVFNRLGGVLTSVPALGAVRLRSLRDLGRFGSTPVIVGEAGLIAPQLPMLRVPLQGLLDGGFVRRMGARAFQVSQDVTVEVAGQPSTLLRAGERFVTTETFVGQELVPVFADFAGMRARRERGGG